ncbi:MAG: hypothetical protein FJY75_09770, partial [Candidatus Eisenbacteria bacterium]|nr:hypothetical protein [Candidatus Eisenbacteria bacterium]
MAKMRTGCNGKRRRAPIEGGARASRRIFALAVSVLLACAATALAPAFGGAAGSAVPEEMSFQGYLTVDGVPLEGTALVGFAIYAAETGGAALWTQAESEIEVAEGLYTAVLRSLGGLSFDAACWLEVTVDGEPLAPRYPLLSVPYALRASLAERVAPGGVDGAAVLDGSLTAADIATPIVSSISGVTHHGGDIALVAGDNVTIVPDAAGQTITISAADGAGGDVTDVIGGAGLTAIDSQGPRVTLAVGAGPGIAVSAEAVGLAAPYLAGSAFDARFVNENQAGSITTAMIVPNIVSSISGVTNDGGNITLRAGENVAIAPDNTTNTITISASHDG